MKSYRQSDEFKKWAGERGILQIALDVHCSISSGSFERSFFSSKILVTLFLPRTYNDIYPAYSPDALSFSLLCRILLLYVRIWNAVRWEKQCAEAQVV